MRLLPGCFLLAVCAALLGAPAAASDVVDETALAERYAPVIRLVAQEEECGYGEPYTPLDVDTLFAEPTVALRGPWTAEDLIEIGPSAEDLSAASTGSTSTFPETRSIPAVRTSGGTIAS